MNPCDLRETHKVFLNGILLAETLLAWTEKDNYWEQGERNRDRKRRMSGFQNSIGRKWAEN